MTKAMYIEFGFDESSDRRPQCIICLQMLSNEAMKPAELKRHLTMQHPQHLSKSKEFSRGKARNTHARKSE